MDKDLSEYPEEELYECPSCGYCNHSDFFGTYCPQCGVNLDAMEEYLSWE